MPEILEGLLKEFREGRGDEIWPEFLDQAGGLLLQVARSVTHDEDDASEAFVFVCERLAADGFARLRRFDPAGPARPATWLRAVARNLCVDHYRARHGRFRVFEAISQMPALEQLVFRRRYRDGLTVHETLESLRAEFPDVTIEAVAAADNRVSLSLGWRQLWALTAARPKVESLDLDQDGPAAIDPPASDPSPEATLADAEQRALLRSALARLSPEDRLLVRLRIDQGLTLGEVAVIAGLRDPQQADRRLRAIYRRMRDQME
jgi:RNA polymerase sigma factor (sigma-70 family)